MSLYKEMGIEDKVEAARANLHRLKKETMVYTHVSSDGSIAVDTSDPGYVTLQSRIASLESSLQTVSALADAIQAELVTQGVTTIAALREAREVHNNTIHSGPLRAWDQLRLFHERPVGQHGYPAHLPSDLCEVSEYAAIEGAIRAEMEAAAAALVTLNASLETIGGLSGEARAALRD
ncbi:MAG: hypothetical protein STSR0001_10250 [Methanothrix sp.]